MIKLFQNRRQAGRVLAQALRSKGIEFDLVMAVPRGGVVVGEEVAAGFGKPLDVVMVKKFDDPCLPEYAIGAVTPDGEILLHEGVDKELVARDHEEIMKLAESIKNEINLRLKKFRNYHQPTDPKDRRILLVDDGIASGFTIKGAVSYLRRMKARQVFIAVPVCSGSAFTSLSKIVDEIICLEIPPAFYAVGQFYQDFAGVEDSEVIESLTRISQA
ncbi:MAG: phosphoribosyltransferase family protein [Syntrophomonas sp.]